MFLAVLGRRSTAAITAAAGGALQHLLPQQQQSLAAAAPASCIFQPQQRHQQQLPYNHHYHHQQQQQQQHLRAFSSSSSCSQDLTGLQEFFHDAKLQQEASTGRAWFAKELRNKSFDDLHKLWYVCLKERNLMLTQIMWLQKEQKQTQQGNRKLVEYTQRYKRVKLTMNRIKQVLSERAHNEADAVKSAAMKRIIHFM